MMATRARLPNPGGIRRVRFDRRKYGRHLLLDVAWVHDLRGFIVDVPHALAFYDITLVTRGRGSVWLDAQVHDVQPGTLLFTSPGAVRAWNVAGLDGICLFFEGAFLSEFLREDTFLGRLPFFRVNAAEASLAPAASVTRRVRSRLLAMRNELADTRADTLDVLRAQLHETLLMLARDYAAARGVARQRLSHPTVDRFLALVEQRVAAHDRVADYASELAVSPGHLSVLCSRYLGRRAKQVLRDAVVERALRLLVHGNDSVQQVGGALGFDDPSYFGRFMRRETGAAPGELRRRSREIGAWG